MSVRNDRGVIAEDYHDLQGLGLLEQARASVPLRPASPESTVRAVLQSVEILALNLADLTRRATVDLELGRTDRAVVKLSWARGFHGVLVRLSAMPQQLADGPPDESSVLCVADSPAVREYGAAVRAFDRVVLTHARGGRLDLPEVIRGRSVDDNAFRLLHLARTGSWEAMVWEDNLRTVTVPVRDVSYRDFVAVDLVRRAVFDRTLRGDTYFTQFRGLHQVPETLSAEVNDHLERAIRLLRDHRLAAAAVHIASANVLAEGALASLTPLVDCLATADYHEIRENLGLTSGSHSVSLRYHLFTHLYEQLWEALAGELLFWSGGDGPEAIDAALRAVDRAPEDDDRARMLLLIGGQCRALRSFIVQWRSIHLQLPRNNLGGGTTTSLTGSREAVRAVQRMRDVAHAHDPMSPLVRPSSWDGRAAEPGPESLTRYVSSDASLDSALLAATAQATQDRFKEVQQRLGYFSARARFTPPPPRRA